MTSRLSRITPGSLPRRARTHLSLWPIHSANSFGVIRESRLAGFMRLMCSRRGSVGRARSGGATPTPRQETGSGRLIPTRSRSSRQAWHPLRHHAIGWKWSQRIPRICQARTSLQASRRCWRVGPLSYPEIRTTCGLSGSLCLPFNLEHWDFSINGFGEPEVERRPECDGPRDSKLLSELSELLCVGFGKPELGEFIFLFDFGGRHG